MRALVLTSVLVLLVVIMLLFGGIGLLPCARAEELVPKPDIHETHIFDSPSDAYGMKLNEGWGLLIDHGGIHMDLGARKMTQNGTLNTDYTFDINYYIGNNTQYLTQFMMMYVTFRVGNQTIIAPLRSCDDFILTHTPIQYDGAVPTFWCNITYKNIDVYPGTSINSTFDLTLCHHFACGWNETSIKVEALFDLRNVTLINHSNDLELDAGEPYAVEVHYGMMVGTQENAMTPTGHTNTSLDYKLRLENGTPVTLSKLTMNDDFSVFNASGSSESIGYSKIEFGRFSNVTHGFPGLIYKDTLSMKSDPEITVFHDGVGGGNDWLSIIAGVAAIALVLAVVLLFLRRKK